MPRFYFNPGSQSLEFHSCAQFTSSIWINLWRFLGFIHSPTTSFHPQSNGLCRGSTVVSKCLWALDCLEQTGSIIYPWCYLVSGVFPKRIPPLKLFLVLRWFCQESFWIVRNCSPRIEYLRRIQSILKNNTTVFPHYSAVLALKPDQIPSSLTSCSPVFIREDSSKPLLSLLNRGPYIVLSRNPKYFLVQIGSKPDSVSVDWLLPVFCDQPLISQKPPRLPLAPAPLIPSQFTPALLTLATLTPAPLTLTLLTLALLTPAPLTPTSPIPLQRAKRMKKQVRFSPQHSPPLLFRRNPE